MSPCATSKIRNKAVHPRAARPVVTCYLMPLAFSVLASLAPHRCSYSCQQLYIFVAAKTPVHSCDQSFIQQNVLSHYYVLHSGPDVPEVTNHFGAWNAFLPLSLPCGLWGQRNWVITRAPSFISFVLMDDFLFLLSLSSSGYKECNVGLPWWRSG